MPELVDMEKPCMPEVSLLDEPLQAMQDRLRQLLADWPENPILTQLLVLCQRLTGGQLCLSSRLSLCSSGKSIRRAGHVLTLTTKSMHPSGLLAYYHRGFLRNNICNMRCRDAVGMLTLIVSNRSPTSAGF